MFGLYAWCLLEADNVYAFWFLLGIEQNWGLFAVLIFILSSAALFPQHFFSRFYLLSTFSVLVLRIFK